MQAEEEVGRQHQVTAGPGVRQVPEGSGEQGKMEKTVFEIICGALTTVAVKGKMRRDERFFIFIFYILTIFFGLMIFNH